MSANLAFACSQAQDGTEVHFKIKKTTQLRKVRAWLVPFTWSNRPS